MIKINAESLIIHDSKVYGLTVKENYCPESLCNHPCDFCDLHDYCVGNDPQLCTTFGANSEEFYVDCGIVEVEPADHKLHVFPLAGFQFV